MFKKSLALFLLIIFSAVYSPLTALADNEMTLSEFLRTTDDITAKYEYPGLIAINDVAGKKVLSAHTPIIIRCEDAITTRDIVNGSEVNFSVLNDITDSNGVILIKRGTPVTAQITFAKTKGMIGRSGELTISDFHTTAVDGSYVPLSGSISAKPDDKMTVSIVLSVLICPLFLLMRGEEAKVNVGTTKTAYTVGDTYIRSNLR